LNIVRRAEQSWLPESGGFGAGRNEGSVALGLSLFQIGVREIDDRAAAKPGDLIAGLAWLTGRVAQGIALRETPESFVMEQAANGTLFLRSDQVSRLLCNLETDSLASVLFDAALLSGARRFPELQSVRRDAMEALERRGEGDFRGVCLSGTPGTLASILQSDVEHLLFDQDDRMLLFNSLGSACAHAVGYGRHRLEPALAAELALSVAFHAGWVDQRKSIR
jgi:hypothetical protein